MRRRKPATIQINVRLDGAIVHELEMRAKANRISFSEEARQRIVNSLNPKPEPSLADFRASWLQRLRDAIEAWARKEGGNIEEAWGVLQAIDAEFATFSGGVETKLSRYVSNPLVRQLLRGAPTLPGETASKA